MITNISDRKDTKFLSYNNTLSVEIKFHCQIIAFSCCIDAIPLMKKRFKEKGPHNVWKLLVINAIIWLGSFGILFAIAQYVKSQGIVFG